jgi:hypothetical protein
MSCVFDIHNEFGRFFDEKIYKRELARRFPGAELEVPIEVRFESFCKLYFLDVLIGRGGAPGVAFKVTALPEDSNLFEIHARRLLEHTRLDAIQWINVARKEVSFRTIRR